MPPEPDSTAELLEDRVVSLAPGGGPSMPPAGRWVLFAGGVIVALAAALLSARWSAPPLAAVASPSPVLGLSAPTPVVEPVPTTDSGPCGVGRIQVNPVVDPFDANAVARLRTPAGGLLATAIEQGSGGGSIVVSRKGEDGATVSRVVATFQGSAVQDPYGVSVVGWSAAGDTMLVRSGHERAGSADRSCSDLFLVWADGSGVQYLTGGFDSDWIASTGFGPRTGQVAFVQDDHLWVPDSGAASGFSSIAPCIGAAPAIRWSPDERRLFAICDGWLVTADGIGRTLLFPWLGVTVLSAVWSADSKSITLVSDAGAGGSDAIGPLVVLDVDPLTGTPTQRLETTARLDWTEPSPFISPDGKWLVAEAFVSDFADASFTALDLTSGATTDLPWQIPRGIEGRESFAWLPDNETMLYADGAILYELNVREMTRAEVGSVPDPDFAWLNRAP